MKPETNKKKLIKHKQNAFNFHITKEKFSVLGKRSINTKTRPGQAREKAIQLRKSTLLKEYKTAHKTKNGFKDRRLGENDPTIDEEKKAMLRLAAINKKESKRSMYNLNDEVLTHKGVSLNDDNMQDLVDFSDEEEEDDDKGQIAGDTVTTQHFGGMFSRNEDDLAGKKSQKEWINEIIAESKKKKLAAKEDKSVYAETVAEINSAYQSFLNKTSSKIMSKEYKDELKKDTKFSSYDKFYHLLSLDAQSKACPTDRLKTDDELQFEHDERIKKVEAERVHRMKNAFEQDLEKNSSQLSGRSADDLGESYKPPGTLEEPTVEQKKVKPSTSMEIQKKNLHKEIQSSEEENKKDYQIEANMNGVKSNQIKKKFPKIFEVPDEFQEFWQFLKGYSPSDVSAIIGKFIETNHPTTGKPHEKCCQIFAFLLKVIEELCKWEGESLSDEVPAISYCEFIIGSLYQLVHLSPATSANIYNEILKEKFSLFSQTQFKQYPYADTFIFLRMASILYPVSDFEHDVLTAVHVFLASILGHAKVQNKRDILAILFTSNLLFEYNKTAKRFMTELMWALKSLFYLAIPESEEKIKLYTNHHSVTNISTTGPKSNLLVILKKKKFKFTDRLLFSSINNESDIKIKRNFKLLVISETLKLLANVVETYSALPIAKLVFRSIQKFVDLLPINKFPEYLQDLHRNVTLSIVKISGPGKPLVKNRARPQAITQYEPRIEEVKDSKWKKDNPDAENQRQKHLHKRERKATKREIKKDFQFIANAKLKDTIARDNERKRKLNTLMRELGSQEGEYQKYKKSKSRN